MDVRISDAPCLVHLQSRLCNEQSKVRLRISNPLPHLDEYLQSCKSTLICKRTVILRKPSRSSKVVSAPVYRRSCHSSNCWRTRASGRRCSITSLVTPQDKRRWPRCSLLPDRLRATACGQTNGRLYNMFASRWDQTAAQNAIHQQGSRIEIIFIARCLWLLFLPTQQQDPAHETLRATESAHHSEHDCGLFAIVHTCFKKVYEWSESIEGIHMAALQKAMTLNQY